MAAHHYRGQSAVRSILFVFTGDCVRNAEKLNPLTFFSSLHILMKIKMVFKVHCSATSIFVGKICVHRFSDAEANFRFGIIRSFCCLENSYISPFNSLWMRTCSTVREFWLNKFTGFTFILYRLAHSFNRTHSRYHLTSTESSELNLKKQQRHLIQVNLSVSLKMILMNLRDHWTHAL